MRAINHFTVKAMKTVGISDTLKIEHEGELVSNLFNAEEYFDFSCKNVPKSGIKSFKSRDW